MSLAAETSPQNAQRPLPGGDRAHAGRGIAEAAAESLIEIGDAGEACVECHVGDAGLTVEIGQQLMRPCEPALQQMLIEGLGGVLQQAVHVTAGEAEPAADGLG